MLEDTTTLEPPSLSTGEADLARELPGTASLQPGYPNAESSINAAETGTLRALLAKVRGSVSTWGFVDQGVVSIASFAAAAIVGRVCGSVELGIYSLAVKIFWLAAGIPNALVWMPYTSRAPRMNHERQKFFLGSATIHTAMIAVAISLVLLAVGFVPLPGLSDKSWLLPMCIALVPFSMLMMLKEHLRRMLLAHMQTSALLRVDVPIVVFQLLILGGLALTGQLSATTALMGMALGCSWAVLWVGLHRERFRVQGRRVAAHWGHNFQFGKWLLVVSIAWLLGDASYYWLVEEFHGLTVMGQFSAAAITVMLFNPILLTVQNLARSILSNSYAVGGQAALWEKAVQGTRWIAIGFGVLFLGLALCGGRLVGLFFGSEFVGLEWTVASLCLGMYLHVACSPVEAALTALQDGRAMLVASLLRLGMILAAGVPLIAMYGPIGVGLAMACGALSAGIYEWFLLSARCGYAR